MARQARAKAPKSSGNQLKNHGCGGARRSHTADPPTSGIAACPWRARSGGDHSWTSRQGCQPVTVVKAQVRVFVPNQGLDRSPGLAGPIPSSAWSRARAASTRASIAFVMAAEWGAASPAPAHWRSPPSRILGGRVQELPTRGGPPARGILAENRRLSGGRTSAADKEDPFQAKVAPLRKPRMYQRSCAAALFKYWADLVIARYSAGHAPWAWPFRPGPTGDPGSQGWSGLDGYA